MSGGGPGASWSDDRWARLALSRLCEPGDPAMAALVRDHGAPTTLAAIREARPDAGERLRHWSVRLATLDVPGDRRAGESAGARFLVPGDDEWPAWLLDGLDRRAAELPREAPAPLGLWVRGRGRLDQMTCRAVAVVGCRAPTVYGVGVATLLGQEIAVEEVTVVSGAAYGIDRAAHEGALTGEGDTVAVLAGGVDVPYPRGNSDLIARIARVGLVVAEAPPRAAPTRVRFLRRNRLIAALSQCTVVVEAAHRSGALSTAAVARHLLRPVGAVPGPVSSSTSAGCHRLLREPDVTLIRDCRDVLEMLGPTTEVERQSQRGRAPVPSPLLTSSDLRLFDVLDDDELRVVEALPVRRAVDVGRLLQVAGLDLMTVQAALTRLESKGLACCRNGQWKRQTVETPPGDG